MKGKTVWTTLCFPISHIINIRYGRCVMEATTLMPASSIPVWGRWSSRADSTWMLRTASRHMSSSMENTWECSTYASPTIVTTDIATSVLIPTTWTSLTSVMPSITRKWVTRRLGTSWWLSHSNSLLTRVSRPTIRYVTCWI